MQLVILFLEFFKTGLFAVGGGLATLPFLYALADKYPWLQSQQIPDMIAVSESTPGPMGVNMATYAGFHCDGVLGSIVATVGLVTPSIIVIIIVYQFLERFRTSRVVENIFYGLRPVVVGLIGSAGFGVIVLALFAQDVSPVDWTAFVRWKECILFVLVLAVSRKWKKVHPIALILAGAVAGILFQMG
ncbi:chromate transporter [Anaerotignum lactatifermentans]|uniref:Chromate transporter n=1 Tax=Anaerotignum lactatifermentans TaxID=160404 RepID=A0ABS2GE00_9FIRM|nr:chromate transporter [Anaerotignum lactatifermentans]MBM6830219.1 chromate transporter [Anaerotignum lactatifermentans]MBM6878768.1 chromate transporter [Anaerotignum lactatifermentans]MBM6951832.1 chromate transporter [Anaerotignum lactatifermentans]